MARRWRYWPGPRGACLVRSPYASRQDATLVAARDRASAGYSLSALHARLGPLAGTGALAPLPSGLCSFPLARLVGLRFGRIGRHGNSQSGAGLFRLEAWRARE